MKPLCLALVGAAMLAAAPAQAAYILNIDEVGPDVIATGSGSFDLNGLSFYGNGGFGYTSIFPLAGAVSVGNTATSSIYTGLSGPAYFGLGTETIADSGTGPGVLIANFPFAGILVPTDYVSGTDLGISTSTFLNQSLASLGATPGTYVWTWGDGETADSFTVNIGQAVPPSADVPAPAALGLLGLGALTIAARRRRR